MRIINPHILCIALTIMMIEVSSAQIQNPQIDYVVEIHEVNYYNNGNEGSNPEPAWEFTWSPTSPSISPCEVTTNFSPVGSPICITAPDETRHDVDIIAVREYDVPPTRRVYWKMEGWENDDLSSSRYCTYDSGDDEFHCGTGAIDPIMFDRPGERVEFSEIGMGSSSWIPKVLWGYHNGKWNGDPLRFGNAMLGTRYSHYNTNRSSHSDIGYKSQFYLPDAPNDLSPEVVYSIEILGEAKELELSLADNVTASYIHIVKKVDNGFEYIESVLGNNPTATRDFCTGNYYFVIEPVGGKANHQFTFSINVIREIPDPMVIDPGAISYPTQYYVRNIPLPHPFSSMQEASHPGEPVSYFWQESNTIFLENGMDIINFRKETPGENSKTFTDAYDGQLRVLRIAKAGCWQAESNEVVLMGLDLAKSLQADSDCDPTILGNNNIDSTAILSGFYKSSFMVGQGQVSNGTLIISNVQDSFLIESGFSIDAGAALEVNVSNCID